MAIKKVIKIDADTKNAQKNVQKLGDTVNNEAKEIKGSLGGLTDELDGLSGGLLSKFKNLKGTLGNVAVGFKGIGVAIAASGIGLLVTVIAAVTAAFKSSEEGQDKFQKILGVLGSIVGNLMDLLSDFGETVIEAFENPKKAWNSFTESLKKGYEFVKGQIIDRFSSSWTILSGGVETGILKMRIAWNDFTGDADEAQDLTKELEKVKKEVEAATEVIKARNQEVIDGFNAAIDKVKEFGKEIAEDAKKAQAIANQRALADKKERELIVARARADRNAADLREKAVNKEKFSIEERIKFLEQAARIETDITNAEIYAAKLRRDAKIAENALAKSTKEDLDEQAELTAKVIELETARLNKQKELTSETLALKAEEKALRDAELAALEAQAEKEREIERARLESIDNIRKEYREKLEDLQAEDEQAKLDLEEQRKLAELEALNASEEQKIEVRRYYDELQTQLEKEQSDERIANALAEKEAKAQIFNAQADLAIQFGQFLQQMGEENKALAITGIIVEQVASVARIISNTGIANAKAVAASPLTAGQPFVTLNSVSAGLSIASSVASAAKAIGKLGGGGGGLQRDNPNGGNSAQPIAPEFNLIGQGGINQVAQSLNQQGKTPLKAYVVGKEVDTQQELDRNRRVTATFG
ncbi:coiled-coil domain-containing protein [Costertonia aggregata]|uniref:Uncharacterized protein n=1 Tax=Costertonia aggregata TaxID=343403 RepID=A0A7H9ARP2_9FLAO|nr:hypothetical protein [Costertonia aggregata]QLG46052.1 hypothetical protein HYG79_12085 [Costertonia aggregata]